MNELLTIDNLHVTVEEGKKEILSGLNLEIKENEFHVVMGPNGSGKSTLALTLMGHPRYRITHGRVLFMGEEIAPLTPDERGRRGIFLAFQQPEEVEGVRVKDYLNLLLTRVKGIEPHDAGNIIRATLRDVWFSEDILGRYINEGFSGGEKKRFEILQALLLKPKLLILDEPDSGVDIDSLSLISSKLRKMHGEGVAILLITHYGRILQHVDPRILHVHILREGRIVMSGQEELVERIEQEGFRKIFEECGCNE